MQTLKVFIFFLFYSSVTTAQIWINEFHYDNNGQDENEFIEVAGVAGTNLSTWSIELYNQNGDVYDTYNLTGTIPNESAGFGAVFITTPGLDNGPRDGFALLNNGFVVELLSYEGTFTGATGTSAANLTSTDVGVQENGSSSLESLQRTGDCTVNCPIGLTWIGPLNNSPGFLNASQSFLPVEWSYFKGERNENNCELTWETLFEQNNDYFSIEHSEDAKTWTSIGEVLGQGTTDGVERYSFLDEHPTQGMNYYRLKQVDYDGAYEYSSLVSVDMGKEEQIYIYPNPVSNDEVTFEFENKQKEGTNLLIYHINGQLAREIIIEEDSQKIVVAIDDLVKGMYMVRLVKEQNQLVQRFVKH